MMKLNGWIRSLFLCLGCQLAANPSVHVVKQGEVTVCSQGNETWIVQSSDRAVIHWQDFSIRAGEIAHFMQPSKDAAILNRVIGALPSTIDGSLLASGKVYLINPQGVLIGPHGKIQTNGFVATTLEIADEAFLANQAMGIGGASEARIINLGLIEALEGDVVLIAREVENTGIIQAKNGTAALAGASEVLLSPQGGQKIFIKPQAVGRIDNGGSIEAVQAEIRAAGGSAYSLAINQTGIIEAAGTGEQEGRIVIQAEKNNTTVSGTLVAQRGDQTGGTVHVLGESVDLIDHCTIDVSGKSGGGTICIGGDPNHFPPIPLATTTYVGPDVLLKASVDDIGDGGKVVAWGKEAQYFYGTVEAQGGKIGGNGGFVEVSCLKTFDYHGLVNTLAPHGKIGILLLDPSDITISAAASSPAFPTAPGVYDPPGASGTLNNGDLQTGLGTTNILVTTAGGAGGTGNITWSAGASIAWAAATTLTLTANRAMSLGSNITNTGIGSFTAMDFTANSGGASAGTFNGITVAGGVTIASTQGAIIFNGRGGNTSTSNIGVQINAGAIIQSTGAGASAATISITGHGGTINSANNYGVEITGALAKITSVDGAISVTGIGHATSGTGNSFNHGIYIHVGGSITSTGIATIALNGTGAAAQTTNTGVTIDGANSLITSVTGAINITGVGGAGTSNNSGVVISGSAKVTSTGAAALAAPITINGTGGGGTGSNNGILIDETGSRVTTADGSITLTGSSNGTTTACHGISMNANGGVTYGGVTAGTITLTGTGSGSTGNGVNINTSAGITADTVSPKNIVLTGTPSDLAEDGIRLSDPLGNANTTGNLTLEADTMNLASGTIQTTGAILIEQKTVATSIGLAGGAGTLNIIAAELDTIQAGASSLTIGRSDGASTMTVNAYTFNNPVTLVDSVINTGGAVSTGAGMSITLTADTMAIGAALSGTGTLKIQPLTASTSIGLADGAVGTLNLTTAELNFLGASFTSITFGAALGTGTVDMRAYSTYATPLIVYGGTISVNGALVNSGNQSVTFYIGPAAAGVLNLSATVTTSGSFQINGGGFNDNYNIITTSAQTATLSGNGGTNTIAGPSTTNTWTITADNAGTLNTNIAFSNVQILTGNDAGDNFTFNGAFAVSAINGGAGTDSITGPNVVNAWTITADNAGALTPTGASGPTTFSNIGALIGGSVADTFTFTGAFRLNGATGINGGTGTNSLTGTDVNTAWSITGDNAGTMTPTGASGATTFSNVGALVCGTANDAVTFTGAYRLNGATGVSGNAGTNTITGPDIATAWSITADNGGSLNPTGSSGATTFSSFSTLTGGTAADSFTFAGAFQISGSINGGTGSNSLTGPNVVNAWSITADNAGTLTPTGASGATTFTNIGALVGGSVADTFTFTGAFRLDGATGIDGGAGANSLTAPNVVNAWSITGDNAGSLTPTGSSGATTFANVGSLIGGNAADSFTFTGAYRLNGATGIDGGAGSNSLTGPNVVNTWSITADNTGTLTPTGASGATTFANIAALTGGSAADSFTFTGAFQLNGATGITGGTGTDTVTGPNLVNAWSISGANAGSLNPAGASGATTFANIDNLAGGSTDDTLTGPAGGNTWAINALNGGSLTTSGISFTGMEKIVGGAGNDDFAFTAAGIITGIAGIGIEGGGGSNSVAGPSGAGVIAWSVTGAAAGSIDPGAGATTFISIQLLAGNSTHDTLTGPAGGDTWTINAADGGSLTASGISFTGIESLVGGAGNDNFTFTTAGKLSGDGGIGIDGGAGTNTITGPGGAAAAAWSVTGATTGLINAGAGITTFTSIQQLSGNSTNDTLTGPDSGDTWTINASNGGSLASGISFTGMEKFVGGAGDDNYTFTIAGVITGIGGMGIDGGGGSNVVTGPGGAGLVDWSATGPSIGAINPGAGATTFTSIEQLTGMSTNDILTGPAAGDNWTINASNGGYLAVFNFSGMEKLVGGAGNDLFTFTTFGVITGIGGIGIDGGGGTNTITGPSGINPVAWSITGATAGSVDSGAGVTTFTSIQILAANSTKDTLTGLAGGDTWTINAQDGGFVASGLSFSSMEKLVGGAGNDNFIFTTAGRIAGIGGIGIDGGAGTNIITGPGGAAAVAWSVTGATTGLINAGAGITTFTSIQQLAGNSTNDTLTGLNSGDTWTINASNGGSLASGISFSGMEKLVGGAVDDNYTFTIAGVITGIGGMGIDGGGGTNIITGPGGAGLVDWTVTGSSLGSINSGAGITNFTSIQTIIGQSSNDRLTDIQANNTWHVTAANAGDISTSNILFSGIENLRGGAGTDLFILSNGVGVTGVIDGGVGGTCTLDYGLYLGAVAVNLAAGTATGTGGIADIQTYIGGAGNNTLTGANSANTWTITANNAGNINGTVAFSAFQNLTGGSSTDTFDFTPGFTVAGTIDGGAGSNTLKGPNAVNVWNITNTDQGTVAGMTFVNIANLVGGTANDSFVFADQKGVTGSIDGGAAAAGNTFNYFAYIAPPADVYLTTASSGTASNLGVGFTNVLNFIGNVIVHAPVPPPPSPVPAVPASPTIIQFYSTLLGVCLNGVSNYSAFYLPTSIQYQFYSILNNVIDFPLKK